MRLQSLAEDGSYTLGWLTSIVFRKLLHAI